MTAAPATTRTAATVGTFDGVHLGHACLIETARAFVGPKGRVVVFLFDPHPLSVLRPGREPARLSTFVQRQAWLLSLGADEVIRLEPTHERLQQSPEQFIAWLVDRCHPTVVVEGPDFRFGKDRAGDTTTLIDLGARTGFEVRIVAPVDAVLDDHSIVPARSTIIRWLIRHGRVKDAAAVLGRPYQVEGFVERGDRRGRTIGYPTANINTPCLLPADGVYVGTAHLDDGRRFIAAISVGTKPTFDGNSRVLEAFLTDARPAASPWQPISGLPEYGWSIRLDILAFLRDQVKFSSMNALLEQMSRDCDRARAITVTPLQGALP